MEAALHSRCSPTSTSQHTAPAPESPHPRTPAGQPVPDSPHLTTCPYSPRHTGSDNIFVSVPGKLRPTDEPARLAMNSSTPPDHFPGLHWYHPHYHGSSMLQTSTANGLIIVEGEPGFRPILTGW